MARVTLDDISAYQIDAALGYSDEDIRQRHGWGDDRLAEVRARALGDVAQEAIGVPIEDLYTRYILRSQVHIRQLDRIRESATKSQAQAAVGAVRAKQSILDSVIQRGQEFGFVPKQPDRKQVAVLLATMSEDDLRRKLVEETRETRALLSAYGDKDFLDIEAPVQRLKEPVRMAASAKALPPPVPSSLASLVRAVIERKAAKAPDSWQVSGTTATP